MKYPSISEVAAELSAIADDVKDIGIEADEPGETPYVDVRLQVHTDGSWQVHSGDSQYDTDHRGFWGSSAIPADGSTFNPRDVAFDLIHDVMDHCAQSGHERTALLRAWRFFRSQAVGSVGENALSALHLVRAEAYASDAGWTFTWDDDHDPVGALGDHAYWCADYRARRKCGGHEVLCCVLRDREGTPLASLGAIIDPSAEYSRVIEAELALEALPAQLELFPLSEV